MTKYCRTSGEVPSERLSKQHIYTINELQDSEKSCRKLLPSREGGKIDGGYFWEKCLMQTQPGKWSQSASLTLSSAC